ncbi:CopD family protein [Aggregatilineales bacterium SYSU G02658]
MDSSSLALSLFVHILATVVYIGGLLVTTLLVFPEVRRVIDGQPAFYRVLSRLRQRFYPISNLCLAALWVTGLLQMTADPNYDGFLTFDNDWSRIMLLKHLLIVGMMAAGVALQYGVAPSLERVSLLMAHSKGDPAEWQRLRRAEVRLTGLLAALGVAVLACSAAATAL